MNLRSGSVAALSVLLLAGCGGGGGSSGAARTGASVGGSPQAVVITEANAKTLAANALDAAENLTAAQAGQIVTGVEVQVPGLGSGPMAYAEAAAAIARRMGAASAAALPMGVSINQTVPCAQGGTITMTGSVASSSNLSAGDSVTLTANSCRDTIGAVSTTMSGRMTISVATGSVTSTLPYRIVMDVSLADFSVQSGTVTSVGNGDMRMDLSVSSTGTESLSVSGNSLASRVTGGSTPRAITLKSYSQSLATSGVTASSSVSATVVADSSRLSSSPITYTLDTPAPVTWNTSTGVVTAGALKVVGAKGAQLLVTVGAGSTVTIQLDANGDGTYERSIGSSVGELSGLL